MGLKNLNSRGITAFVIYTVLLLGGGFYAGTQDWSEKTTVTEKNRSKEDIKIVERIVEKPGGERIIYRTRTEKRDETERKKSVVVKKDKTWIGGLAYGIDQKYTISLDKKVFTNVYAGLYGTSDGDIGVGLKFTF